VRRALVVALLSLGLAPAVPVPTAAAAGPPQSRWERDVQAVMAGSGEFLARRVERGAPEGKRLAVNLDIDNTMLATEYDSGAPVRPVLRFARRAQAKGVAVLVNSARPESMRQRTRDQLAAAGYDVNRICLNDGDSTVVEGKQACRRAFNADDFTIIANVGNRSTDFERGPGARHYGRTYDLPDYGGRLG